MTEADIGTLGIQGVDAWAKGDWSEAGRLFDKAIQESPQNAKLWGVIGEFLGHMGKKKEAISAHKRSLEIEPENGMLWSAYGVTMTNMGGATVAIHLHKRALELDPSLVISMDGMASSLLKCHLVEDAIASYERLVDAQPQRVESVQRLCFSYLHSNQHAEDKIYKAHRMAGALMERAPEKTNWPNSKEPERKLKVGFFGSDWREHSCAYFLYPLLRNLDRDQFEIHIFNFSLNKDRISAKFRALADGWRDCTYQASVVPQIQAENLDIAVDCGGMTAAFLPLFAYRLAPVQISYLGYPHTTGLTRMDYRITDAGAEPESGEEWSSEKLIRLPNAWAFQSANIEVPPYPSLKNGHITFGSFNNFAKVTDEVLRAWGRIMQQVPGSQLALKSFGMEHQLAKAVRDERFMAAGIPVERVLMLNKTPTTIQHLQKYSLIDISLDPWPYNGTTTTLEAIWMGRPVICLEGQTHRSRVSQALVKRLGRPEWVAKDVKDYVERAVAIANDLPQGLREQLKASPMLDYKTTARDFGNALRQCWRNHCGS